MTEIADQPVGRCPLGHSAADRLPEPAPLPYVSEDPFHPPRRLGELRAEFPVSPLLYPDGEIGWLVTRYADVKAVLADPKTFSSRGRQRISPIRKVSKELFGDRFERPGLFSSQDPPVHGFYRKQLTGQFTVKRMKSLEQRIEQIVADQLEYMASRGPVADLVADFALPVPSLVICELLGVDYAEHAFFEQQTATLLSVKTTPEQVIAAGDALAAFMLKLVRQKRNEPDDALLSGLIEAQREAERPLTDDELAGIAMMLLTAGHETTANMLGLGTLTLLHHTEQLAKLKADMSLVDTAVEELLRFNSIIRIGQVRLVTQDVQIGGRLIPAGSSVVASSMAANRDPEKFENPDELDITRGAVHHVAFGHGIHQCLGQQLARIELRVGYRRLFERFPDLRLAIPLEDVTWRTDMAIYGVRELPVTW